MEYTPMEKDVLAIMQRTDFKNISKGDVISFAWLKKCLHSFLNLLD